MAEHAITIRVIADALSVSKRAAEQRANRESWPFKEITGCGGKRRLYSVGTLPAPIRHTIIQREACSLAVQTPAPTTDLAPIDLQGLSDKARQIMQSRLQILAYLNDLSHRIGSQGEAIEGFIAMVESGKVPPEIIDALHQANARNGKGRLIHRATLYRWLKVRDQSGVVAIAPKQRGQKTVPTWLPLLLALYQNPNKPSVADCVSVQWGERYPDVPAPVLRTAQRRIADLPVEITQYGRMGKHKLRSVQPFVRRSTEGLWPMDIVTVDGHLFKAYVAHPMTGRRFRPELTVYLDIGTRKAVGFSAWLAESQYAIWIALQDMVLTCGVPAVHYSDNGAYRGKEHRGVLARIGTEIMFSEAYRAQARGIIERFNSSVWIPLAKRFPTYVGDDSDPEAVKKALKRADKTGDIVAWTDFIKTIELALAAYNQRQHSMIGMSPDIAWAKAVEEGWQPTLLDRDDLHDLLPSQQRKVIRGEVRLPWGRYFSEDLRLYHGHTVQVGFTPTNGDQVWVSDDQGRQICVASRDGNVKPYIHHSKLDYGRAQREQGRIQRLERKIDDVREEGAMQIEGQVPGIEYQTEDDGILDAEVKRLIEDQERQPVLAQDDDPRAVHAHWVRMRRGIDSGAVLDSESIQQCRVYWHSQSAQSAQAMFDDFSLTEADFPEAADRVVSAG